MEIYDERYHNTLNSRLTHQAAVNNVAFEERVTRQFSNPYQPSLEQHTEDNVTEEDEESLVLDDKESEKSNLSDIDFNNATGLDNRLNINISKKDNEDYGFGLVFEELPKIQTISPNGAAIKTPLKIGDVIHSVNSTSVQGMNKDQILKLIKQQKSSVLFEVERIVVIDSETESSESDSSTSVKVVVVSSVAAVLSTKLERPNNDQTKDEEIEKSDDTDSDITDSEMEEDFTNHENDDNRQIENVAIKVAAATKVHEIITTDQPQQELIKLVEDVPTNEDFKNKGQICTINKL